MWRYSLALLLFEIFSLTESFLAQPSKPAMTLKSMVATSSVTMSLSELKKSPSTSPPSEDLAQLVTAAMDAHHRGGGEDDESRIVWLEHLNIVVGDRSLAERFYFEEGLGLTRDPSKPGGPQHPGTMWANLGSQQFHLAMPKPDDPPQAIYGSIGLCVPYLDDTVARLMQLRDNLRESGDQFPSVIQVNDYIPGERATVYCPWGNVFHLYDISYHTDPILPVSAGNKNPPKMVTIHAPGKVDTGGRMCVRSGPGIRYVEFKCSDPRGAAMFYHRKFGCAVFNQPGVHSNSEHWAVNIGVGPVHFVFTSVKDISNTPDEANEAVARQVGVHACLYVSNFAQLYDTLPTFTNPRFKHLDTCDTIQEALDSRTFRFKNVVSEDGNSVLELEHEVRMLRHKSFMKSIEYHHA